MVIFSVLQLTSEQFVRHSIIRVLSFLATKQGRNYTTPILEVSVRQELLEHNWHTGAKHWQPSDYDSENKEAPQRPLLHGNRHPNDTEHMDQTIPACKDKLKIEIALVIHRA
jgi:hypothetical protein